MILQTSIIILEVQYLKKMRLEKIVKASIFTSIAIGLGFTFLLVPNVEFISVTVFLSGFTLGPILGSLVGLSSMLIYSTFNPLGSGLVFFPLLVSQVFAMALIGIFGSINRRILQNIPFKILIPVSGFMGAFSAVFYDLMITIAYPISIGYGINEIIAVAISGILFTITHVVSNSIIFSVVVPAYIKRLLT